MKSAGLADAGGASGLFAYARGQQQMAGVEVGDYRLAARVLLVVVLRRAGRHGCVVNGCGYF